MEDNLSRLREDFRLFLYMIWKHLNLPDPTPTQYDIAYELQHGGKRTVIQGFRGVGKSWITAAFVLWCLWNNPQLKFLVVSASGQRAKDFTTFCLRLLKEVPILEHLQPGPGQRESVIGFDVGPSDAAHAPSVASKGITSQLAGSRAHHIISDDAEVINNSATQDAREKLLHAVSEFEAILVPEGKSRITFLGTPQTEDSIYSHKAQHGYTTLIWPARYPTIDQCEKVYHGCIAPRLVKNLMEGKVAPGDPTDPQRFGDIELCEREAAYGRSGFRLQFMLDTSLADADRYPLKLSDLIICDIGDTKAPVSVQYGSGTQQRLHLRNVGFTGDQYYGPIWIDGQWEDYAGVAMAIDPAGRGKDETGYAVVAHLRGFLFLLDAGGLTGGYSKETLEALAHIAKRFQVNDIIVESNFGDGMFTEIFTPVLNGIHKAGLSEVRHSTQKERRIIDTLEPILNQHRLVVRSDVVEQDLKKVDTAPNYSLFFQLTRITRERNALKHDDALDALSIVVNYWVEMMAQDHQKIQQKRMDAVWKEELKNFAKNVVDPRGVRARPTLRNVRQKSLI